MRASSIFNPSALDNGFIKSGLAHILRTLFMKHTAVGVSQPGELTTIIFENLPFPSIQ